ncbi:MAG TPA: UvrD-helicase domain-containing protein [Rhabdochlamydiaceae bacterium]|nr:UvrD-helicase domain-containing protein [Rhabdochlamydiaceae bacterium]
MVFDVLDRTVNPLGSHLLEASAGTGKTFAIQHVVARLLLSGSMTIDQILVVTFTRAATRELKVRIRSNLEQVLHSIETGKVSFDYVSAILEQGEEAVRAAKDNIEAALTCFDAAQIFTIHSFCHRMLSECAFQANVGMGLEDPDDNQHQSSLRRSAIDFFRTQLKPAVYGTSQLVSVLSKHKQDFEKLANKLVQFAQRTGQIIAGANFSELLADFNEKMHPFPSICSANLMDDFERLKACYKKMTAPEFPNQAKNLAMLLEKKHCSLQEFDHLLQDKEFFLEMMDEKNQKVRSKFPDPATLHYPGLFKAMRDELYPIIKQARDPLKIFLRMARDFQLKWTRLFEHQERLSHDQILKKMEECLRQKDFCEAVRGKYRAAIIDEFQDTDPIQWNIFNKLFMGKMQAVYLVGDPKQSIYGFRNADIYTYLDAAQEMGKENISFLDTNYRSDPSLVKGLNALFSEATASQWLHLPTKNRTLPYLEVKARNGAADYPFDDGKGSLHFFLAEEHFEKKGSEDIEKNVFFPFIAKEIIELRDRQKIDFQNICILVKDRFQAANIQEFLKRCSIPSFVKRAGCLTDSHAMPLLRQLLVAAIDPEDVSKIKTVLAGPFIGWQTEQIKSEKEHSHLLEAKAAFHQLSSNLFKDGFASFFHNFLQSKWGYEKKMVLETLTSYEDLSLYRDLMQLAEILIEYQTHSLISPEGLLSYLLELSGMDPEEDERLKRRQEEAENSVSIMTIHMSKGLEFEIVFALGLASRLKRDEEAVRIKVDDQNKIVEFDPSNPECLHSLVEQDAEKMRYLYVALTRAKKRVYVPAAFNLDQDEISLGKGAAIELFFQKIVKNDQLSIQAVIDVLENLKQTCGITYEQLTPSAFKNKYISNPNQYDLKCISPPHIRPSQECIRSFTSLNEKSNSEGIRKEIPSLDSSVKNIHTLPPSVETGHLLHRILEKVFASGKHSSLQLSTFIREEMENTHLRGWEEVVTEMVEKILNIPLLPTDEKSSLNQISPEDMQPEMEFVFSQNDSLLKGFIDLVFQLNGKYYLLDWKSNWLGNTDEDYGIENIEREMRQHGYFLQAAIYAEALKRYVKLFDTRPLEECFGGAIYVFLRGRTVYHFVPDTFAFI